ncbi:MAG: DUF3572 family protein [Hyphomicrobiaceae bacterium]
MLKSTESPRRIDRETAETIAAQGLAFLAADAERLARFLALTGLQPADLAARVGTGEVLSAVLSYLAADESLLLTFAANSHVAPETIGPALALLDAADAR